MKILLFEVPPQQEEVIRQALPENQLYFFSYPLEEDTIPLQHTDATIISVWVCSTLNKKILENFKKLRLIVSRSTGIDHIDTQYTKQHNITVTNMPVYASVTVAEHTIALILALSRKICDSYYQVKQEHLFSLEHLTGFELQGKTLGIIGMGNIGKHVAKIASSFGMNILACDKCAPKEISNFVDLSTLLKSSDIITIHLPLTPETHHLINLNNINQCKKGSYLINTARGGIVQTEALLQALCQGIIAGAGLDVLEDECYLRCPLDLLLQKNPALQALKIFAMNQFLINQPNVIVTPHNAFNSAESSDRLLQETIEIIKKWLKLR